MKFSPDEVIEYIDEYSKANGITIPSEDVLNIAKTYNLAYDYEASKLQEGEVIPRELNESILGYIIEGRTLSERGQKLGNLSLTNETFEEMAVHFSDVNHMNYFDNFFGYGETRKIQKALFQHGIPVDILKGIKANQDFEGSFGDYYVEQDVYRPDGGSPIMLGFSIVNTKTGETVYEWVPDTPVDSAERILTKRLDSRIEENNFNFFGQPSTVIEGVAYAKKATKISLNVYDEEITAEGYIGRNKGGETYKIIRYRDARGRFIKKPQPIDEEEIYE